jgi:hypothetical protein
MNIHLKHKILSTPSDRCLSKSPAYLGSLEELSKTSQQLHKHQQAIETLTRKIPETEASLGRFRAESEALQVTIINLERELDSLPPSTIPRSLALERMIEAKEQTLEIDTKNHKIHILIISAFMPLLERDIDTLTAELENLQLIISTEGIPHLEKTKAIARKSQIPTQLVQKRKELFNLKNELSILQQTPPEQELRNLKTKHTELEQQNKAIEKIRENLFYSKKRKIYLDFQIKRIQELQAHIKKDLEETKKEISRLQIQRNAQITKIEQIKTQVKKAHTSTPHDQTPQLNKATIPSISTPEEALTILLARFRGAAALWKRGDLEGQKFREGWDSKEGLEYFTKSLLQILYSNPEYKELFRPFISQVQANMTLIDTFSRNKSIWSSAATEDHDPTSSALFQENIKSQANEFISKLQALTRIQSSAPTEARTIKIFGGWDGDPGHAVMHNFIHQEGIIYWVILNSSPGECHERTESGEILPRVVQIPADVFFKTLTIKSIPLGTALVSQLIELMSRPYQSSDATTSIYMRLISIAQQTVEDSSYALPPIPENIYSKSMAYEDQESHGFCTTYSFLADLKRFLIASGKSQSLYKAFHEQLRKIAYQDLINIKPWIKKIDSMSQTLQRIGNITDQKLTWIQLQLADTPSLIAEIEAIKQNPQLEEFTHSASMHIHKLNKNLLTALTLDIRELHTERSIKKAAAIIYERKLQEFQETMKRLSNRLIEGIQRGSDTSEINKAIQQHIQTIARLSNCIENLITSFNKIAKASYLLEELAINFKKNPNLIIAFLHSGIIFTLHESNKQLLYTQLRKLINQESVFSAEFFIKSQEIHAQTSQLEEDLRILTTITEIIHPKTNIIFIGKLIDLINDFTAPDITTRLNTLLDCLRS